MKKIILLIALITAPLLGYSQSMFDKLEEMDDVTVAEVNKEMFRLLSKFDQVDTSNNDIKLIFETIEDLDLLRVYTSGNADIATQMEGMVKSTVKSKKLTQLIRVKENKKRVYIYVESSKNSDIVSEVLMFIKGIDKETNGLTDVVVMSLTGKIDLNKISKLTQKMMKNSDIKITNKK